MSIYNTPLEERFGEKLEELREGKNMTRERLAEQVGLTRKLVCACFQIINAHSSVALALPDETINFAPHATACLHYSIVMTVPAPTNISG